MKRAMLTVFLTVLTACNGDIRTVESGSVLLTFNDSGCKKVNSEALTSAEYVATSHALFTANVSQYPGLTCFSWDATGTTLKIDCLNFEGGCDTKWHGDATAADGNAVELYVSHDPEDYGGCAVGACGACIYEWSFEAKSVDASKDSPLTLTRGGTCETNNQQVFTFTLPLASRRNGIACRYFDYSFLTRLALIDGSLHAACGSDLWEGIPRPCNKGLACTAMPDDPYSGAAICLQICAADNDCPLNGLLKCEEGVCALKDKW